MEQLPSTTKSPSAETIAKRVFDADFEGFARGNPMAFRGRTVEIEGNNVGDRRVVFITETVGAITAEHVAFNNDYSRATGALKLMKDLSPSRIWRPSKHDINGALLFALGEIQGQEATPEQLADFTPLVEALREISETG